jgi:4-hydroxybenzoate polyprenyltransferase
MGVAQFLSLYFALQALGGEATLRLGWRGAIGSASTVLGMLLVRLQDDVTDAAHDVRLGRAGDPRYRDRPIVRGEITVVELRGLSRAALALLVGINLAYGLSAMFVALLAGGVLTWLGFRWFFISALARDPSPLAYLARKALTVCFGAYALAAYVDECRPGGVGGWAIPLLLAPVAGVAAWETARKIRIPEDETDYGTYSKVLGWRRAALLPVGFIVAAMLCLAPVARAAGLGWTLPAALGATGALVVGACLRFRLAPTRARADLRRPVEIFGAVAHGGLAAALALHYGVVLA